jgi:microcystin degradation protein MlrC
MYEDFEIFRDVGALTERLGGEQYLADVDVHAVYLANATPGGVVTNAAYARMKSECLAALRYVLPVEGVLLDLHGAMEVEGLGKSEPDLAAAVRVLVGESVPLSVSLDLHGNLTQALLGQVNCVTAFRTAPHRDYADTVGRAIRHLLRCVREGLRPQMVLLRVPLLIPGEYAMTTAEPARSLYGAIDAIEQQPGILDASLMVGYAWADRPHSTASVVVVAERDHAIAMSSAQDFAQQVWAQRRAFAFPGETAAVEQAVRMAMTSEIRPVFVSDSGDNVTAGGAGDMTQVLERLLAQGATLALVAGIEDAAAVGVCKAAGAGARVELRLGNKRGLPGGVPLPLTAWVERVDPSSDCVVIRVDGVRVVVTASRRVFFTCADIEQAAGVDPLRQQLVVVKLGYLMPDLYDRAPRSILALSPGLTDLDLRRFDFHQVERPIYPLDSDTEADWPDMFRDN